MNEKENGGKKPIFRIITAVVLIILLAAAGAAGFFLGKGNPDTAAEDSDKTNLKDPLLKVDASSGSTCITNGTDGYVITIPGLVSGNIEYSEGTLSITGGDVDYKFYMEEFDNVDDRNTYIGYSNKFTENKEDHWDITSNVYYCNGRNANVTTWNRDVLSGVSNDKNYYLVADMELSETEVLTISMKSSEPLTYGADCEAMAASIQLLDEIETLGMRNKWNAETKKLYKDMFSEDTDLTWGIYKWGIDQDWKNITGVEDQLDHEFDVLLHYTHFDGEETLEDIYNLIKKCGEEGRTLELTLQTVSDQGGNTVYKILNGEYDEYLNQYAKQISDLGVPVLFRLCNEMNGDWCQYSAFHTSRDTELFIDMYKYIYRIFEKNGANYCTLWVWNPNEKSFPNYKWNSEFEYYPGDEYVDIVGITGYNTGTYYEGETWRSFDEIYEPLYQRTVANYDKPIMITEFACSDVGGDKNAWIKDMFKKIEKYDEIKVAVWWDGVDLDEDGNVARSYLIEDSDKTISIFKKNLKE